MNMLFRLALALLDAFRAEKHMKRREPMSVATTTAKTMVTTRPDVVRLLSFFMQMTDPAAWVEHIRPAAQETMGVSVVMQLVEATLLTVDVLHSVIVDCEVAKQMRLLAAVVCRAVIPADNDSDVPVVEVDVEDVVPVVVEVESVLDESVVVVAAIDAGLVVDDTEVDVVSSEVEVSVVFADVVSDVVTLARRLSSLPIGCSFCHCFLALCLVGCISSLQSLSIQYCPSLTCSIPQPSERRHFSTKSSPSCPFASIHLRHSVTV